MVFKLSLIAYIVGVGSHGDDHGKHNQKLLQKENVQKHVLSLRKEKKYLEVTQTESITDFLGCKTEERENTIRLSRFC